MRSIIRLFNSDQQATGPIVETNIPASKVPFYIPFLQLTHPRK